MDEIRKIEDQMRELRRKLAELRRQAPPQPVEDCALRGPFGETVRLSELFGSRQELIVVHNMGHRCGYCTMWGDGFNGVYPHLEDRAAFVVESWDEPETMRRFAADRRWGFRMVSSAGTSFRKDLGYGDGVDPEPGISVFRRDKDGRIHRVSDSPFGPGDNYCIVWDVLDLLPSRRDWRPDYHYFRTDQVDRYDSEGAR